MNKANFSLLCLFIFGILSGQNKFNLEECVTYGLERKLIIKQAILKDQQAKYEIGINKKKILPNLDFGSSLGLNYSNFNETLSIIDPKNINLSGWLVSTAPLYQGNLLNNYISMSELDKRISEQNIFILKENLTIAITNLYLDVVLKRELIKISESQVSNAEEEFKRSSSLFSSGIMSEREYIEVKSNVGLKKQELDQAKSSYDNARFNLSNLLEIEDYQNFQISDDFIVDENYNTQLDLEQIIDQSLLNRSEIIIKKLELKKSDVKIDLSKTYKRPNLSFVAATGTFFLQRLSGDLTNSALDFNLPRESLGTQANKNWFNTFSFQFKMPLLNKAISELKFEQSKIEKEITEKSFNIEKNELKQKLQRIYFDAKSAYQQLLLTEESEKLAKTSLDFAYKSYTNGLINVYDYNNTKNTYFQIKIKYLQSKYTSILKNKIFNYYIKGFPNN